MNGYRFLRPFLFQQDPEEVHERAIAWLHRVSLSAKLCAGLDKVYGFDDPRLRVRLFGETFSSPLGIAAGFDKNGVAVPALRALGFAFVEIGTVTPRPQAGNERPRMFRLKEDVALVNRLGFPNEGVEAVGRNLARTYRANGYLGLNVGPNKESVEAGSADADCIAVIERLAGFSGYVVVNVSSPNTARLRQLQGKEALHQLLSRVLEARSARAKHPMLVKIAPDLTDQELDDVLDVVMELNLDGIVATNTTIARPEHLKSTNKTALGGLSGRPLRERSREVVRRIHRETGGRVPIIAAGGIFTGADVLASVAAGATLVQTYTGFVYRGPGMAERVKQELVTLMERQGIRSLDEVRGTKA
ncbi:MAG: dihydroorotate dehydrogenase [Thermomicrobiales bacterium]|nr:dihydroorotate dehydrogenase [Thermomicrobiales bacterium]